MKYFKVKKRDTRSIHACYIVSVISNSATLWTVALQAPLSMKVSTQEYWGKKQEYWRALPCLSPGDLSNLGTKPALAGE